VLYVDGGIDVAERFLRRELRHKLMGIDPASMIGADYKSALQEKLQAAGGPGPDYAVVEVQGPDHRRVFRIELRIGGRAVATGEGHTIKLAQQEAARSALESPDNLIAVARGRGENVAHNSAQGLEQMEADQSLSTESFEDGSQALPDGREGEEVDDASPGFVTAGGKSQIAEGQHELRGQEVERATSGELSADAEGEFEVRSVTNDV
jgi:hypothetical protein